MLTSGKTVTSAGTAVALHAAQRVKSVTIVAKISNSGQVYVGGSDVASTTNDGMAPGDSLSIPAENWLDLNDLYVDSDFNGEGVDFWAVKA
jgi:hypothetical protein